MLSGLTRAHYQTLLDAQALQAPSDNLPAILYLSGDDSVTTVTRAEFRVTVARYGRALARMGVQPRDLVIIAHTQNLESIFAFWGAIMAGAIPSMFPTLTEKLDVNVYMERMAQLVRLSEVRAILTTGEFAAELQAHVSCPVYGSQKLLASLEADDQAWQHGLPDQDDIAFLQHSSGTTGLQKGVALSHRAVLNHLASYSQALGLRDDDLIVSWLPLYHDMGLIAGFILPLVQGIPLLLMSPFHWVRSPAILFKAITHYRATLCWLPNFAYNHCVRRIRQRDLEGVSLASMRAFINCSEPVHYSSQQAFLERFAPFGLTAEMLGVSYAMAENVFAVTQTPVGQPARLDAVDRAALEQERRAVPVAPDAPSAVVKVSCGPAIERVGVKVVDEAGSELAARCVGEIAIQSDSMLSGYHRRPDLNPLRDGWYLTGDMGYIAEGEVYVIGRKKDLIINGGKNVYPQDLEAIVNTVAGVHPGRAVAFGVFDEREGTELIGVVAEVHAEAPDERSEIVRRIRQAVAAQTEVTVSYVHLVDSKWLLKTSSGKIARAANRDKWLAETQRQREP